MTRAGDLNSSGAGRCAHQLMERLTFSFQVILLWMRTRGIWDSKVGLHSMNADRVGVPAGYLECNSPYAEAVAVLRNCGHVRRCS